MNRLIVALVLAILPCTVVMAEGPHDPVDRAVNAYKTEGIDKFLPALLKGSPIEGEKSILAQVNNLRQVEAMLGALEGYEFIQDKTISKKSTAVYFAMNYEKGPLYVWTLTYESGGKHIVLAMNFNTDYRQVLPSDCACK